jgi:hypothetical protein
MKRSKASSPCWHQQRSLSRRDCIRGLAVAAVVPAFVRSASASARAPTAEEFKFDSTKLSWRVFQRDDFGFSVELPREPEISIDEAPGDPFKDTAAEVWFDVVTFNVRVREPARRGPITAAEGPRLLDAMGEAIQKVMQGAGFSRFTLNGCPGREDVVVHNDGFKGTYRTIVCGGRVIQISVLWVSREDTDPAAERFLRSFRLLPGRR